jgi:rhamnulokinase
MKDRFKCIAVDMGAGSIRVMLGTLDDKGLSYEEVHRITNEIVEIDGHDRWRMDYIAKEIIGGIAMAAERADHPPESIGVDSWGVDFVLLDENGELVDTPVAYRDSRTGGMQELWRTRMSELETFQRTGINFYIFNTLFQLLALKGSREIERTSKILFIPCYINYLLTGRAENEVSISSTSQMLSVNDTRWDAGILGMLDLHGDLLGDPAPPGTRLGPVIIPGVRETGMEGIAVCGHDTACVVAAIPVASQHYAYISAGTWCIVGIESTAPLVSEEAFNLGFTNERGYGNTYRILKNTMGLWLLQGLKKHLPEGTSYKDMEEMVRRGGGSRVLQVIDPDDPGFYNPGDMKEAFDVYFDRSGQDQPGDLGSYLRCAYDSMCFSFRYHVEQLERLSGRPIEVLHVVGGGSQSDYLNQRVADTCGRRVISGPVEGATLGNILVQALSLGKIGTIEDGRELIRKSFPVKYFEPGEQAETASRRFALFLELKR